MSGERSVIGLKQENETTAWRKKKKKTLEKVCEKKNAYTGGILYHFESIIILLRCVVKNVHYLVSQELWNETDSLQRLF